MRAGEEVPRSVLEPGEDTPVLPLPRPGGSLSVVILFHLGHHGDETPCDQIRLPFPWMWDQLRGRGGPSLEEAAES